MGTDLEASPVEGLRAMAEPIRWRIIELLAEEELCVCHLVELLEAPQSLVSHHLRALRQAGLVESEKFSYWTYYRLAPQALARLGRHLLTLAESAPPAGGRRRPCC
jgi:ArsR family transcriptional regulator